MVKQQQAFKCFFWLRANATRSTDLGEKLKQRQT
jgi:hypothetical protein